MHTALIWDLDGTLLDSYRIIVPVLHDVLREYGLDLPEEEIHEQIISTSVTSYLQELSAAAGMAFDAPAYKRFSALRARREGEVRLIPHVKETLQILSEKGVKHYIFTHSGKTTPAVLHRLGVDGFFEEIVTNDYGFARKPAPDAINYLIEKHALSRADTCYIGDRTIDMNCARNAQIKGILYLPEGTWCRPDGSESMIVHDLLDLAEQIH